jgi:hypothetical protein
VIEIVVVFEHLVEIVVEHIVEKVKELPLLNHKYY